MKLQLQKAKLIKRYKRFLADVETEQASFTIHCANTGAMTGCANQGDAIWYSTSDNAKRKYPNSWELTQTKDHHLICVNTIRANQLVEEALTNGAISDFGEVTNIKREVKYGNENSKVDFLVSTNIQSPIYIEVKSVTLLQDNKGYFPDAVTTRGQKHLRELIELAQNGQQAVLLFAVLHSGINSVSPATHVDKKYAQLLSEAQQAGVSVLAYKACFENKAQEWDMKLTRPVPIIL